MSDGAEGVNAVVATAVLGAAGAAATGAVFAPFAPEAGGAATGAVWATAEATSRKNALVIKSALENLIGICLPDKLRACAAYENVRLSAAAQSAASEARPTSINNSSLFEQVDGVHAAPGG
jgi:hypothetical protein